MSKELEALQDLSKLVFIYGGVEQYKIIETALKEKEQTDMLLEQFGLSNIQNFIDDLKIVAREQKQHKALEIIKTVCPNVFWVMRTYNYEEYKKKCTDDTLLQEEYKLLREVLL